MKRYLLLVLAITSLTFGLACKTTPSPVPKVPVTIPTVGAGVCYRIEFDRDHADEWVFVTPVLPVRQGDTLILKDAVYGVLHNRSLHFDRRSDEAHLFIPLAERLDIKPSACGERDWWESRHP